MFLLTDVLCFSLTFLAILVLTKVLGKKSDGRRYPPSLPSLPILGSLPFIRKFDNLHEFFRSKVDELGPIYTFREGGRLCLTLNSRETIEEALVTNNSCFAGRAGFYTERISNANRKGILSRDFTDDFKCYHRLSLSVLKEFGFGTNSFMQSRISEEFEALEDFIRAKEGKEFDPSEMASLCTYNVIKNIVFGKREEYVNGPDDIITNFILFIRSNTAALDVAPFLRIIPYFSQKIKLCMNGMFTMLERLEEEIQNIKKNGTVECFVSSYIDKAGQDYDQEQLIYTARDLIAAGSGSTATTLLWLMIFIANNPAIQDRLQKEVDGVIPRDRLPSHDDQTKLPFVEATILEVLRIRSVVPIPPTHQTMDDSTVCGYFVPALTKVFVNLYAANMNPKFWGDPDVFRPERFLDNDNTIIGKDRVIAFSLGRRSCFGEMLARQELFLLLAGLIQRFNILPGSDGLKIDDKPVVGNTMTPSPFAIRMIPRDI